MSKRKRSQSRSPGSPSHSLKRPHLGNLSDEFSETGIQLVTVTTAVDQTTHTLIPTNSDSNAAPPESQTIIESETIVTMNQDSTLQMLNDDMKLSSTDSNADSDSDLGLAYESSDSSPESDRDEVEQFLDAQHDLQDDFFLSDAGAGLSDADLSSRADDSNNKGERSDSFRNDFLMSDTDSNDEAERSDADALGLQLEEALLMEDLVPATSAVERRLSDSFRNDFLMSDTDSNDEGERSDADALGLQLDEKLMQDNVHASSTVETLTETTVTDVLGQQLEELMQDAMPSSSTVETNTETTVAVTDEPQLVDSDSDSSSEEGELSDDADAGELGLQLEELLMQDVVPDTRTVETHTETGVVDASTPSGMPAVVTSTAEVMTTTFQPTLTPNRIAAEKAHGRSSGRGPGRSNINRRRLFEAGTSTSRTNSGDGVGASNGDIIPVSTTTQKHTKTAVTCASTTSGVADVVTSTRAVMTTTFQAALDAVDISPNSQTLRKLADAHDIAAKGAAREKARTTAVSNFAKGKNSGRVMLCEPHEITKGGRVRSRRGRGAGSGRGRGESTARGRGESSAHGRGESSPRGRGESSECGRGRSSARGRGKTNAHGKGESSEGESSESESIPRGRVKNWGFFGARRRENLSPQGDPLTLRLLAKAHAIAAARRAAREKASSTAAGEKASSTADSNSKTSARGRGESSARGRGESSARGRGESSARGRGESSARGRGESSARGRGESSARGRGKNNARGRGRSSARGRGKNSARGRGENSTRGRGGSSARGRGKASARGRGESSARGRSKTSARGRGKSNTHGKGESSESESSPRGRGKSRGRGRGKSGALRRANLLKKLQGDLLTSDTDEDANTDTDKDTESNTNAQETRGRGTGAKEKRQDDLYDMMYEMNMIRLMGRVPRGPAGRRILELRRELLEEREKEKRKKPTSSKVGRRVKDKDEIDEGIRRELRQIKRRLEIEKELDSDNDYELHWWKWYFKGSGRERNICKSNGWDGISVVEPSKIYKSKISVDPLDEPIYREGYNVEQHQLESYSKRSERIINLTSTQLLREVRDLRNGKPVKFDAIYDFQGFLTKEEKKSERKYLAAQWTQLNSLNISTLTADLTYPHVVRRRPKHSYRYLMYIRREGDQVFYISDNDEGNAIYHYFVCDIDYVKTIYKKTGKRRLTSPVLLDGYLTPNRNTRKGHEYHIYDIIAFNDIPAVQTCSLPERLDFIAELLFWQEPAILYATDDSYITLHLAGYQTMWEALFHFEFYMAEEVIMFQPEFEPYEEGPRADWLVWTPPDGSFRNEHVEKQDLYDFMKSFCQSNVVNPLRVRPSQQAGLDALLAKYPKTPRAPPPVSRVIPRRHVSGAAIEPSVQDGPLPSLAQLQKMTKADVSLYCCYRALSALPGNKAGAYEVKRWVKDNFPQALQIVKEADIGRAILKPKYFTWIKGSQGNEYAVNKERGLQCLKNIVIPGANRPAILSPQRRQPATSPQAVRAIRNNMASMLHDPAHQAIAPRPNMSIRPNVPVPPHLALVPQGPRFQWPQAEHAQTLQPRTTIAAANAIRMNQAALSVPPAFPGQTGFQPAPWQFLHGQMQQGFNNMQPGGNYMQQGGNNMQQGGNNMQQGGNYVQQGGNNMQQGGNNTLQGGNYMQQGGTNMQQGGNYMQQGGNYLQQGGNNTLQRGSYMQQGGNNTLQGGNNTLPGGNNTLRGGNNTLPGGNNTLRGGFNNMQQGFNNAQPNYGMNQGYQQAGPLNQTFPGQIAHGQMQQGPAQFGPYAGAANNAGFGNYQGAGNNFSLGNNFVPVNFDVPGAIPGPGPCSKHGPYPDFNLEA